MSAMPLQNQGLGGPQCGVSRKVCRLQSLWQRLCFVSSTCFGVPTSCVCVWVLWRNGSSARLRTPLRGRAFVSAAAFARRARVPTVLLVQCTESVANAGALVALQGKRMRLHFMSMACSHRSGASSARAIRLQRTSADPTCCVCFDCLSHLWESRAVDET